jgi:hypothetical protein
MMDGDVNLDLRVGDWHFSLRPPYGPYRGREVALYAYRFVGNETVMALQPDGSMLEEPAYTTDEKAKPVAILQRDSLQALMDELWRFGVRPQARRYEEETALLREVVKTQEKHLEDMRSLVFARSTTPKPAAEVAETTPREGG